MRLLFPLFIAILLFLPAPLLAGQLQEVRFSHDGKQRHFRFYIPDTLVDQAGPHPLVMVLHGIASTDLLVMEKSLSRFNQLADAHGFFVVYPNGLARNWDLGEGRTAELALPKRDDLGFLDQVITMITENLPVDSARIFATGFSLGGQMGFSLACNRPGLVRAVATVAMPLPGFLADNCRASPPFGVALIHGTSDNWVPYYGGAFPIGPRVRDNYLSHDQTLQFFLSRNHCDVTKMSTSSRDNHADGTSVVERSWSRCNGPPVLSYSIIGGGHTWPLEAQSGLSRPIVGRVSQEINAADVIWAFFSGFE